MTISIQKFPFNPAKFPAILMPKDAEIVHVGVENDQACVWAIVDSDKPKAVRLLCTLTVGIEIEAALRTVVNRSSFVGAVGWIDRVLHIFDIGERK